MLALTVSQISGFLQRFNSFHDAIIRQIEVRFGFRNPITIARIIILVRDSQTMANEGWVNLQLELADVEEFRFVESRTLVTYTVINEAHIASFDDLFFIDFGGLTDHPASAEDCRKSEFYIAAKKAEWDVEPYQE